MADKNSSLDALKVDSAEENTELNNAVEELSRDYAKYLKVDISSQKATLEEELEDALTRLDEFTALIDMVRGDSSLCMNETLPEIGKKYEEMENIFKKIDQLEIMVKVIKQNMDAMEEKVAEAEEHLDPGSSLKRLFSSLQRPLFSKKSNEPKKTLKYDPPEIFKTEDFFTVKSPSSSASMPSTSKG